MAIVRAGVTAFFGKSYSGKTTLMVRELERMAARALVFDPAADVALERFPSLESPTAVRKFLSSPASSGRWIRTVRGEPELYAWLAGTVSHWRGITWVIDDAPALFEEPTIADAAKRVAIAGRHMGSKTGVELWVISQRPMLTPPTIRSQVQRIRCFYQDEPADVDYLRAKAGRVFAERVTTLRGHAVAAWPEGETYDRATEQGPARLARGDGRRSWLRVLP